MTTKSGNLMLSEDTGFLYVIKMPNASLFDVLECGWIGSAHWPEDMGAAPEWFWSDLEECQDWWDFEQDQQDQRDQRARHELRLRMDEYESMCCGDVR